MQTFKETEKKQLIKKFHILINKMGFDNEQKKELLKINYGVESSTELTTKQLIDLCDYLFSCLNPYLKTMDVLRKRVIAAIGNYLRVMGKDKYDLETIKRIACRASECDAFNDINDTKLRAIYNAFIHYKKAMKNVMEITEEILIKKEEK